MHLSGGMRPSGVATGRLPIVYQHTRARAASSSTPDQIVERRPCSEAGAMGGSCRALALPPEAAAWPAGRAAPSDTAAKASVKVLHGKVCMSGNTSRHDMSE